MKSYELTYLISGELPDADLKPFEEKINSYIQQEEGNLLEARPSTRRKLAYSIRGNNEAILASVVLSLEPSKLADLEKKLKAEKSVIRYLITIKKSPRKIKEMRSRPPEISEPKASKPKTKVELKDIEKKLEEILETEE